MEPILELEKEELHLERLKEIRQEIYTPIKEAEVFVSKSKEPINPDQKEKLTYRPIRPGQIWAGVFGCAWFKINAIVPESTRGKHVVLHIDIGGEGLVYDGMEPVQAITGVVFSIDKFQASVGKSIVEIKDCAEGGEEVNLYLEAGYNGHSLLPTGCGIFQYADICLVNDALKDYYYDYLTLASLLSITTDPKQRLDLDQALKESYEKREHPEEARKILEPLLNSESDNTVKLTAIGHAHLDLAWLWPIRETKRKAARTFINQINNIRKYPEYFYGASQPQQFAFVKDMHPGEFQKIKEMIAQGRIEAQGGMWVEADTNISSGEALIRQIFYGKQFFWDEFRQDMRMCWLPDVFGYNANLPQILKKSGLEYFMTTKLSWNEHNRFPYRSFVWSGIDGSEVLVHMPPNDNYNACASPASARDARDNYPEKGIVDEALLLFGIGDGGGGPGEVHVELVKRQKSLRNSPTMKFGKAIDFFDRLNTKRENLPRYHGELYLEKHQGTYTTQGRNKYYNRKIEYALQDLEALAAFAHTKGYSYPQEELDRWWKEILLYQFHDIIPGSSINRVYEESRARYQIILEEINTKRAETLSFLSSGSALSAYNPTSYARNEYIKYEDEWYYVKALPYGFSDLEKAGPTTCKFTDQMMENEYLRVEFNEYGEIISLVDKSDNYQYAGEYMNRLNIYQDPPLFFNAWDIDWKYYKLDKINLKAYHHETFVDGERVVRRNYYRHRKTEIVQEVVLKAGSRRVDFQTEVDYHERLKMLRADFRPTVFADQVKCDVQLGSFYRSTKDVTPIEEAQFEICAHKYVDVSTPERGLSLLNDCKYGHRVKDGLISLNLLRSPISPDPKADRGHHQFCYSLFPHREECGNDTLKEAYFLNKPLLVFPGKIEKASLAQTDNPGIVIDTIKKAYQSNDIILRLFESLGVSSSCSVATAFSYSKVIATDLMENDIAPLSLEHLEFTPYEIKTIRLKK
ncbi:MAG: alpha-mannosidase [Acholeplasmataceae bacterium]|nr:alpha-mannosidase [Acholeplasmataceae bacterium]